MKRLTLIFLIFALCTQSFATAYYVKTTGSDSNNGTSPSTPFLTISHCIGAMAAGDSCTVYAGDYSSEGVHTITAGTAGNYKTAQVNGTDTVTTKEWVLNSHTKLIGFHIQDPTSPVSAICAGVQSGATDIFITSNSFYACGFNFMIGTTTTTSAATNVYIQQNTFSYSCGTSSAPNSCVAIGLNGDNWLAEGNDFSHVQGAFQQVSGRYNVVRNNTDHDFWGTDPLGTMNYYPNGTQVADCSVNLNSSATISGNTVTWVSGNNFATEFPGSWVTINGGTTRYYVTAVVNSPYTTMTINGTPPTGSVTLAGGVGSACHADHYASEPTVLTQYNLVEGDEQYNYHGNDSKGGLAQGDGCVAHSVTCSDLIERFNQHVHIGSSGIMDNNLHTFNQVKMYNNTDADVGTYKNQNGQTVDYFDDSNANGASLNTIFYWVTQRLGINPVAFTSSTVGTGTWGFNVAWQVSSSNCTNLYSHLYATSTWASDTSNTCGDPKFTSYSSTGLGNLTLGVGSSAIGAGSSLTTVASGDTGTGTDLIVNDCHYFFDASSWQGLGLNVNQEVIRIGATKTNTATVSAINYSTCHMTLTASVTRSVGDGVYLHALSDDAVVDNNNAYDAGALPSGISPPVATLSCPGYAIQGNTYSCTFSATNCTSATLDGNAASCSGSQTFTAGLSGTTETHAYIATGAGGSNESDQTVKITPRVAAIIMALARTANTVIQ